MLVSGIKIRIRVRNDDRTGNIRIFLNPIFAAMQALRTVQVIRYITPLREGGSLPAIAEADDNFLYVLKFRGAGQGIRALIAELIGGELARLLGFKVPELVFANLDEAFGRTEPDEEIQDLLKFSVGTNLALHYLSGAITFDANVDKPDAKLASQIVWLDCFITNMDRTARNTNLLMWHRELWLIDHGACLYFHHNLQNWEEQAAKPFTLIKDHVLLDFATALDEVDAEFKAILTPDNIRAVVELVPDEWYAASSNQYSAAELKDIYSGFLQTRLNASNLFINEAKKARETRI